MHFYGKHCRKIHLRQANHVDIGIAQADRKMEAAVVLQQNECRREAA